MGNHLTIGEKRSWTEDHRQAKTTEVQTGEKAHAKRHLSLGEKAAFGVAVLFSGAILVICLSLTVVGFIFSPLMDTFVFALLTGAAGVTSYVIWQGGK